MATEREIERAFLAKVVNELRAIRNTLEVDNFLIDEWGVGFNDTVIPVKRIYDGPIIVTSILAVYPSSSTSAVINLGQPGRTMALPVSTPGSAGTAPVTSTATGAIAAGAGAAALPAGVAATGFTLSFSAAPSTTGTAVLSNVVGGPYTYNIPSGQTSPFNVTFPNPIAANGAPTLTIAGLGTGAGTIELYGLTPAVAAVATVPGPGFFNPTDLEIQLGIDDITRNLTIAPAGAAYINFIGYADRKQIDRQIR